MVIVGGREGESQDSIDSAARSELRGDLLREREITARLAEIDGYELAAREAGMSLEAYMSGDYSMRTGSIVVNELELAESLRNAGVRKVKSFHVGIGSEASILYSQDEDPPEFTPEQKLARTKFYLSLADHTRESGETPQYQQAFLKQLIVAATATGIDIAWKVMDHGYDAPDIYTTQPDRIIEIITTLYHGGRFPQTMWNEVPRVFQSPADGSIPVEHIGMVQEPSARGVKRLSHSVRMARLGATYEEAINAGSDKRKAFVTACAQVGVKPEAPWLLDDAASQAFLDAAARGTLSN